MSSPFEALSVNLMLPDLWQQDAVRALKKGEDVIVDAPTGAGKTYVFELLAESGVIDGQSVFTVPTRALANDKLADWRARGWDVGIATGDLAENLDAPVIVATLETQRERFLNGDGPALLVIDEYQMIADTNRGLNYELAISLAPKGTQLLLLSGSVANPDEIQTWLERLGRNCTTVRVSQRPVPLDEIPVGMLPDKPPKSITGFWPRLAAQILMADLGPLLIFAPQRAAAEKIARKIANSLTTYDPPKLTSRQSAACGKELSKLIQKRVAFHHSGLSYAARAGVVEPLARAGQLHVIVATMGLAAGINFSMRSVYVANTQYFDGTMDQRIASDELLQMFGRAGRRGLDEAGFVITTNKSPRLIDAAKLRVQRTNQIDWPTLLRVMKSAADAQACPFEAAATLCQSLFSRQKIALGIEGKIGSISSAGDHQDSGQPAFGLTARKEMILNSRGEWERRRKHHDHSLALSETISHHPKRGWLPSLQVAASVESLGLGRICKIHNSA